MALETIAEANKYSRTQLLHGVVEEIVDESPVLALMPFQTIRGNSLTYNRESNLGTATWHNPGDTWAESTPQLATPVTATLKILGGDADVDEFLRLTRSNEQDLRGEILAMKAKAVARAFQDEFIYGDVAANPKGFDGLHKMIGAGGATREVQAGTTTTGGPGTFEKLDELIDLVKPRPDALIMHRRTRRGIRKLARSQGWDLALSAIGSIARPILHYADIPIFINDFLTITEDVSGGGYGGKTGDDTTSIFACRFGADGLYGIDGGDGITIEPVGALETKDAKRDRVKWYVSTVLLSTLALARMSGVDDQDWTN